MHVSALPTLLSVYPDARLVVTHRDPLTVLASLTSLVATLRWAHSDQVDFADIGRYHEDMWTTALDDLTTWSSDGTLDPSHVHHVHYADFVQDQIGVIDGLYRGLGGALTPGLPTPCARTWRDDRRTCTASTSTPSRISVSIRPSSANASPRYQRHFSVPEELPA